MNMKELEALVKSQGTVIQELQDQLADARDCMNGMNDTLAGIELLRTSLDALAQSTAADAAKLADIVIKVEGRNKSAAVKRNMTDADALRVLTGDLKDMSHKEAAEEIGLTYAQVYSARLEFTFKHVHKDLRDTKWKNPWSK